MDMALYHNDAAAGGAPADPNASCAAVTAEAEAAGGGGDGAHRLYAMRYGALAQFCLLSGSNALQWITYATIYDEARRFFGMTSAEVNALSVIFMVVFVLGAPFGSQVFTHFGLKRGVRIGGCLNCLGAALKLLAVLAAPSFALLFTAQLILACAQVFILAAPPLVASVWFGDSERTLATTAGAIANNFGVAVGMLLPPLIVNAEHNGRGAFAFLFGLQLALTVVDVAVGAAVIPALPDTPPSASAEMRLLRGAARAPAAADEGQTLVGEGQRGGAVAVCLASLWAQIASAKEAFRAPSFPSLVALLGIAVGTMWAISTLSVQLFTPFGIDEGVVGWMGFTNIVVGIVTSCGAGYAIDRVRRYRAPVAAFTAMSVVMLGLIAACLFGVERPGGAVFALYAALGAAQSSLIPVVFEFAVELTFPVDEATSGNMLMMAANFSGIVLTQMGALILGPAPSKAAAAGTLLAFAVVAVVPLVLALLLEENLLRLRFERRADGAAAVESEQQDAGAAKLP
jgi:MFS family permease